MERGKERIPSVRMNTQKASDPKVTALMMSIASLTPLKCHQPRFKLKMRKAMSRITTRIGADANNRLRYGNVKSNRSSQAMRRAPRTITAWNKVMNQVLRRSIMFENIVLAYAGTCEREELGSVPSKLNRDR